LINFGYFYLVVLGFGGLCLVRKGKVVFEGGLFHGFLEQNRLQLFMVLNQL
jgi:hypothetical protein